MPNPRDGDALEPPTRPRFRSTLPHRARRLLFTATGLVSLVVLVSAGLLWGLTDYALHRIGRVDAFAELTDRPNKTGRAMNILLVGSDVRQGMSEDERRRLHLGSTAGRRSDTMILAHLSAQRDEIRLVSLPRDWYVRIPAYGGGSGERVSAHRNRLNAAYSLGGPALAVATVEEATGIHIDHYVELDFLGFVKMVDALGGVPVCTSTAVHDPKSGLDLPAGRSQLNGARSLAYVRARETLGDGSDLSRIDRQQRFLAAMANRATESGMLLNPIRFADFLSAALTAVRVDPGFSPADIRTLAMRLRGLDPAGLTFTTVPIADPGHDAGEIGSVALADRSRAARLFRTIREDDMGGGAPAPRTPPPTIPPERIAVEVYNGTTTQGLAARAARDLEDAGFLIEGPPHNAEQIKNARDTVVQYGPERDDSARTLAAAIPGALTERVADLGDDIQVIVGSEYRGAHSVALAPPPDESGQENAAGRRCA